jgi:hypothetical protein
VVQLMTQQHVVDMKQTEMPTGTQLLQLNTLNVASSARVHLGVAYAVHLHTLTLWQARTYASVCCSHAYTHASHACKHTPAPTWHISRVSLLGTRSAVSVLLVLSEA